MPLDVKPLSAARRFALVAFMIALLIGSLALADHLVSLRASRLILSAVFDSPPGSQRPLSINEWHEPGTSRPKSTPVTVAGQSRAIFAVLIHSDSSDDPSDWDEDLLQTAQYATMNKLGIQSAPVGAHDMIAGRPAIGLELRSDLAHPAGAWWLIRLTESGGSGVAICFSGTGLLTDADNAYFDQYCKNGVKIVLTPSKKD